MLTLRLHAVMLELAIMRVEYLPLAVCGSALDGNALLPLQVHVVHLGTHSILASHLRGRSRSDAWQQPCPSDLLFGSVQPTMH